MQTIDFAKYSSIRVGAEVPVRVISDVSSALGIQVIGHANNLLVAPTARNIGVLDTKYDYIQDLGELIEVGGQVSAQKLYRYFRDTNLWGLEFLRALPGSLGGLVKMNAGMKEYEIKNVLDSVCVDGVWERAEDLGMGYRSSAIKGVIFAARFKKIVGFRYNLLEIFDSMRSSHPKRPSCGSCFKNPIGDFAGRLLEGVGLRGYRIGGIGFAQEHANFLVNLGKGSFEDAISLINLGKQRVLEAYGVALEEEVIIIA
ncbi:UDP-N-acetylenolpyruvoylglucosamine reductase [Helicobacter sp. 12S02634-8]|uniref:UDP-N-acetylmuramate dehydrogenase n=1 Tax=Helicobacter sp. 12S02634-8 TaxID=1476199 RepID=UPI000BA5A5C6|nr:UDP-N-acetylmuramate dehydrogenase [Helicobacter sp. 12S02634-8]PAF48194.1 UDP-N-acetylenolpyruvoylglucosamine reductase [Helicobacter sp. 12S02634-8]